MSSSFTSAIRRAALAGAATVMAMPVVVFAQDRPADEADKPADAKSAEIVVTGTLLRGTPPVGANLISVGQDKLQQTGAISSNQLLASLPQVTNYFNGVPEADLAIAVNQFQISRPNLRSISPNNATSSGTLILVDGHRIASAGVTQASVDPDAIPTGAIERVEVVTEGGSSTYGADAVAGVINFITRKKFDGLKVDGHYGFADKYWQYDASGTFGKAWDTGSAYVSYTFTKNRPLFGRDRDFIQSVDFTKVPFTPIGRQCGLPNINIATVFVPANFTLSQKTYAFTPGATGASLVAGTFNACDTTDDRAIIPAATRHGVLVGFNQELDDTTTFDARAFFSSRKTLATSSLGATVTMSPSNPFAITPAGAVLGGGVVRTSETVDFNFDGIAQSRQSTLIKEWGINGELKKKFGKDWELRGLVNYSGSDSRFELTGAGLAALNAAGAGTTAATAINPFNLAATNPAVIAGILDSEVAGQSKDALINLRAIVDGSLFSLPGGDLRVAFGYEFTRDEFQQRFRSEVTVGGLAKVPYNNYDRNVNSLFGELSIPLVGADNAMSFIQSFVVSVSGRYDHYSDFGSTFNPKIGATLKPVSWLALRGNWGTSFTAPTPLDQLGSNANTLTDFPFVAFTKTGDTPASGSHTLALQGSRPNLQPQKADTWSIGFDVKPEPVPGLSMSLSYYHVIFKNILATPSPFNSGIFNTFPNNIQSDVNGLSPAQLNQFGLLAPAGSTVIPTLIANGTRVYETVDFRTGNFGRLTVGGLDFSAGYQHPTSFGGFDIGVNGNYQLTRRQQISPSSPVVDLLAKDNGGHITLQTVAGVNVGPVRAQATWNHTGGYAITPTLAVPPQSRIGSFNTVNLFFKLDVPASSKLLQDLSLTLNINNVADTRPPFSTLTGPNQFGYANGFTLGRLVMFGASKKF